MEVRVLRYFNEIVREGNISGAAQVLHISQPALSRQMKELENELGVTLFERGHRQIKLTQEGSYLFDRAQEITTLVDRTTDQLQKKAVVSGVINIGAGESRAVQPVMACIKHIMAKFPQIHLNLVSGDSEFLRHQLDTGLIEFAILMGHENLIEYNTMPLSGVNRWGIVVAADSPLAQKEAITPADLVGQPLMTSGQTIRQDTFRQWAGMALNHFNFVGQYNLVFNAALLAKTGACAVMTYEGLIKNQAEDNLVFRPLTPALVDQNILVWRKDNRLPNVGNIFIKEMKEVTHDQNQ